MFCTSTLSYFTDLLTSDLHSCKLAVDHLCEDLQVEEEFHYPAESFEVGVTGERRERGGGRENRERGREVKLSLIFMFNSPLLPLQDFLALYTTKNSLAQHCLVSLPL